MAYDKHTWISGETITATELNDMESGIENNSERLDELTATVNKNTTDIDGKLDKSSVTTSLTSTSDTDALAASAGKTLNDALASFSYFKDVSGTTAASGNITLDLNPAVYMVIGLRVGSSSQGIALPWSAGSSWYARLLNTDGTVKANTAVTIRVEYKKLSS